MTAASLQSVLVPYLRSRNDQPRVLLDPVRTKSGHIAALDHDAGGKVFHVHSMPELVQ